MLLAVPKENTKHVTDFSCFTGKDLNCLDWNYKVEGGANVILDYKGQDCRFIGRVLRIRKCSPTASDPRDIVRFVSMSVSPLLYGSQMYSQTAVVLKVEKQFLCGLNEHLQHTAIRPACRSGSGLDVNCPFVIVLPDLSFPICGRLREPTITEQLSNNKNNLKKQEKRQEFVLCDSTRKELLKEQVTKEQVNKEMQVTKEKEEDDSLFNVPVGAICLELKPKSGVLPSSVVSGIKQKVCRFCMHQQLKVSQNKLSQCSKYCPLDLFSGTPHRLKRALQALRSTPNNNLRLFTSTGKCFTDKRKTHKHPTSASTLTKDELDGQTIFNKTIKDSALFDQQTENCGNIFLDLIVRILLEVPILADLKRLQEMDLIDIEGVWKLQEFLTTMSNEENISNDMKLGELSYFAENPEKDDETQRMELIQCISQVMFLVNTKSSKNSWKDLTMRDLFSIYEQVLEHFLISTSAKDCSILISIRRIYGNTNTDTTSNRSSHSSSSSSEKVPNWATYNCLAPFEHTITLDGITFNYIIGVVDLDIKRSSKLYKYYRLDQQIVSFYQSHVGIEGSTCSGVDEAAEIA